MDAVVENMLKKILNMNTAVVIITSTKNMNVAIITNIKKTKNTNVVAITTRENKDGADNYSKIRRTHCS